MVNVNILSYRALEAAGHGSRKTIWLKVKQGKFPPPIDIGNGRVGWLESEILEWLESRPVANIGKSSEARRLDK